MNSCDDEIQGLPATMMRRAAICMCLCSLPAQFKRRDSRCDSACCDNSARNVIFRSSARKPEPAPGDPEPAQGDPEPAQGDPEPAQGDPEPGSRLAGLPAGQVVVPELGSNLVV